MEKESATTRLETSITTILSLVVVLFLPYLSIKTYFADSEIWSINLGYHFLEEVKNYWVFSRGLFYFLIWSFTGPFSEPQAIFIAARVLMVLNALAQLYLLFRIVDHQFGKRTTNWFAILLLVANTFYLTQSYRVRSDMMATTILLATILALAKANSPTKSLIIFLTGSVVALLTTPKAVFLLPVLAIIYLYEHYDRRKWKYILGLMSGLLLLYAGCIFLRLGALSDLVLDLHLYLRNTLSGVDTGISYFSKKSFTYVLKLFTENFWLIFIWALPYITINKKTDKKWLIIHTYLLALLFLAPEKLPFFICGLLPLITCSTIMLTGSLFNGKGNRTVSAVIACTVLLIFCIASWKIMKFMHEDLNREQLTAMKAIDSYLDENPHIRYYDVIGLTPAHSSLRHFAGPNQPDSNKLVAKLIINEKPDLLLRVAKFDYFGETMIQFLMKDYIHVGNGFYVYAFPLPTHLQKEEDFVKIKDKKELSFLSPLFEKYQHDDLIVEVRDEKGARTVFSSIKSFQLNKPSSKVTFVKVSPLPMPRKLPPRNLRDLFKFDTEF